MRFGFAGAASLAALAWIFATSPALGASSGDQPLQVLRHHVPEAVRDGTAPAVGALDPKQRLDFIVHLPVRNQAELTDLLARLADPGNPAFRHWLSVADFAARFGRTESEYAQVRDFARANGFAIRFESPNRLMMVLSGSVDEIERGFGVRMMRFRHPTEARTFYAPDREPSVGLSVPVAHLAGLNDFSRPRPAAGPASEGQAGSTVGGGSGPASSFLGSDMRAAYNMGSNTGTGQAVGLAEFAGYSPSDIALYFAKAGRTNSVPIVNVVVDGGSATSYSNSNDNGEVCLDIEQVASVAPGLSKILVYIGAEKFGSGVDGYVFSRMATDNMAKQLSNSWWWYPDDPSTDDPYFEEMAAQGQTLFNISGDHGAYTGSDANDDSYPAEDVHVVTVGGTALTTSSPGGAWQSEVVWNSGTAGTGGGPANDGAGVFPIQSWQIPVINAANGGSKTSRNTPDVALEANYDNYICYNGGNCASNWGGVSFATPRWAAWMSLVNEQLVANGHAAGLGDLHSSLYAIGRSAGYADDFHDITFGNNDTGRGSSFNAVVGYDLTTGWGSMNGVNLMAALLAPSVPAFRLQVASGALSVARGAVATDRIDIIPAGGFTGKVTLSASGLPRGVTAAFGPDPTSGSSVLTLTASRTAAVGNATLTVNGTTGRLVVSASLALSVRAAQ